MEFKEDELQSIKLKVDEGRPHSSLKPGSHIAGKYSFIEVLGEGGMSAVYKAHDPLLDRTVAIKMLHPHLTDKDVMFKRLRQEGRAISQLNHANIVRVHEFGIVEGSDPFIVMDYVEGESLQQMIRRDGPVAPVVAVDIFKQVASALVHAHERGVLHRDLKPSNIMIGRDGEGKYVATLVDLGIAKIATVDGDATRLTATGEVFGSPLYMSPEQARGAPVDARSELYSLGCSMYETLTGQPVFEGNSPLEIIFNQINNSPEPMSAFPAGQNVSVGLQSVVFQLLEKDPNKRFQSAKEVLTALESPQSRGGVASPRDARVASPNSGSDAANKQIVGGLIAAVCVAVAGLTVYFSGVLNTPHTAPAATGPSLPASSETDRRLQRTWLQLGTTDQLDLGNTDVTDAGLRWVGKLPALRKLWLRGDQVTDAGVAALADCVNLNTLDLADTKVTDKSGAVISTMPKLTDLGVDNTAVTDEFIDSIPPNVVWLSLNGTKITNKGFAKLSKFQKLEGVTVDGANVDDETVHLLSKIPNLRKLYLRGNKVTDNSLAQLGALKNLRELSLNECRITDKGVQALVSLKYLTKLHLAGNHLTDACIPALSKLTSLTDVDLSGTGISAAGILKLASLVHLSSFHIPNISFLPAQFKELQKQHRDCVIEPVLKF